MTTDPIRDALAELVELKDSLPGPMDWEIAWDAARAALAQWADEPVAFWRYRWTLNDRARPDEIRPNTAPPIQIMGYSWPPEPLYTSAPTAPTYVPLSESDISRVHNTEACLPDFIGPADMRPAIDAFARAIESLVVARMRGGREMTALIVRLREWAQTDRLLFGDNDRSKCVAEAADEIERLTAERKAMEVVHEALIADCRRQSVKMLATITTERPSSCTWPECGCRIDLGEEWKFCSSTKELS